MSNFIAKPKLVREKRRPSKKKTLTSPYSSGQWCCPVVAVRKFVLAHREMLQAIAPPKIDGKFGTNLGAATRGDGWITYLAVRVSAIHRDLSVPSAERMLRRVLNGDYGNTMIVKADHAEAICLAVGKYLDRTNIPTLPGSYKHAEELVYLRAKHHGVELEPSELPKLASRAMRVSALMVKYPHNIERLHKFAPFDCLRGYR